MIFSLNFSNSSLSPAYVKAQNIATMAIIPSNITLTNIGDTFTVNITVSNVQNLNIWSTNITWDSSTIELVGTATEGDFMTQNGDTTLFLNTPYGNITGVYQLIDSLLIAQNTGGISGSGVLATITFKVLKLTVESAINLVGDDMRSPVQTSTEGVLTPIPHQTQTPALVTLISGTAPIAKAGQPQTVNEDTPMMLNGSKTIDPSNNATYAWTFDDNGLKTLTGINVTYSFDYPGVHPVTLTIKTPIGEISNDTTLITVLDTTPPVAVITRLKANENDPIYAGTTVFFSASKSYDPENGTLNPIYRWDFGDGQTDKTIEVGHSFIEGNFNITLTVTDARANLTNTVVLPITVLPASDQPSSTRGPGDSSANGDLVIPPTITGIIIFVTLFVIGGSAFWLLGLSTKSFRRKTPLK